MTDPAQLDQHVRRISTWGRWGAEDERGSLNHLTPEARVAAAHEVSRGMVVSCARPLPDRTTAGAEQRFLRHTLRSGADAPQRGYAHAGEWIGLEVHGFDVTHIDAPAHVFWNRRSYNDRDAASVTGPAGATANAVTAATEVVGRGVLLDLAPEAPLRAGDVITPADLDGAEERQGVTCRAGDLVFVRTGRGARAASAGGALDLAQAGNPGLHLDCADWFAERQIALLGTDVVAEARSAGEATFPAFHVLALVALGLWLVDNLALEELATTCRRERRWHYLAVIAPLPLEGGTGSPINPLAIF